MSDDTPKKPGPPPVKSGPPPVMKIPSEETVEYYFVENDKPVGPLSKEDFVANIRSGRIARNTQVWRTGDGDWQDADKHADSSRLFPPPVDPARKLVELLVGTWVLEFYRNNNSILQKNTMYYGPNMQYNGQAVSYSVMFPEATPGVSQESGLWSVALLSESEFTLTLRPAGQISDKQEVRSIGFTIIDRNTIRNNVAGALARRVAQQETSWL
jgi:GYF domain 2